METTEETANRNFPKEKGEVLVDGVPHVMLISDNSVMFEGEKGIRGFDRSAIRTIKPSNDKKELVIAYSVNGELKSVRVRPNGKWWMDYEKDEIGAGKYRTVINADCYNIARLLEEFVDPDEYRILFLKAIDAPGI